MTSIDQSTQTMPLPAVLDISAAAPLAERLLSMRGSDLVLDASEVTHLGGQCLQVLLAAAKTWSIDRVRFEIGRPSSSFAAALDELGIAETTFTARDPSR
jgi:chemotaxis protein CheX